VAAHEACAASDQHPVALHAGLGLDDLQAADAAVVALQRRAAGPLACGQEAGMGRAPDAETGAAAISQAGPLTAQRQLVATRLLTVSPLGLPPVPFCVCRRAGETYRVQSRAQCAAQPHSHHRRQWQACALPRPPTCAMMGRGAVRPAVLPGCTSRRSGWRLQVPSMCTLRVRADRRSVLFRLGGGRRAPTTQVPQGPRPRRAAACPSLLPQQRPQRRRASRVLKMRQELGVAPSVPLEGRLDDPAPAEAVSLDAGADAFNHLSMDLQQPPATQPPDPSAAAPHAQ
jgi:hypothetical protein